MYNNIERENNEEENIVCVKNGSETLIKFTTCWDEKLTVFKSKKTMDKNVAKCCGLQAVRANAHFQKVG